jgi:hypothetical protein
LTSWLTTQTRASSGCPLLLLLLPPMLALLAAVWGIAVHAGKHVPAAAITALAAARTYVEPAVVSCVARRKATK